MSGYQSYIQKCKKKLVNKLSQTQFYNAYWLVSHHKKRVSNKELVKKNAVINVGTKKIKGKKKFQIDILGEKIGSTNFGPKIFVATK